MPKHDMVDIANYAYTAGFRGNDLVTATAVGWAESRDVYNAVSTDGYGSHGIWQFIPSTWQATTGQPFALADDPQANADAAYKLWKQQGFHPWSTYNSGAWRAYLLSDGQGGIGASAAAAKAANQGGYKRGSTNAAAGPGNGSAQVETGPGPNQVPQRTDSNNVWTYLTNSQWDKMSSEWKGTKDGWTIFRLDLLNVKSVYNQTNLKAATSQNATWIKKYHWTGSPAQFAEFVGTWHDTADTARGNAINPLTQVVGKVEDVASTLGDIVKFLNDLVSFVTNSKNWIRVGEFILGAVLIVMGARQTQAGQAAASVAQDIGSKAVKTAEVVAA